jgi:hypothetical protein
MERAERVGNLARRTLAERSGERLIVRDPTIDVVAMVDVVGERRVHVCEGQIVLRGDLVGAPAKSFVPDRDVLDRDATAAGMGFSPGRVFSLLDVSVQFLSVLFQPLGHLSDAGSPARHPRWGAG